MRYWILLLGLVGNVAHALPINPDVTQENIQNTICVSGYTKSIRPNTSYTNKHKLALMKQDGVEPSLANQYELDHVIPLALGGHPKAHSNLVLQPWEEASRKDRLEVKLQCLVCGKQVTLEEAQEAIFTDWKNAYHLYSKVKCKREKQSNLD